MYLYPSYLTLSPMQQSWSRRHLEKSKCSLFWKKWTFFKLESFENIVAKEEIAAAGTISSFVTMFSNAVCCSRSKNEYLWCKGLIVPPLHYFGFKVQSGSLKVNITIYFVTVCLDYNINIKINRSIQRHL